MRRKAAAPALMLAALLATAGSSGAADFGQNSVITRDLEWKVRSTDHFDIHYYEESRPIVAETARMLETAFRDSSRTFEVETTTVPGKRRAGGPSYWARRPFFLYASPNDFLESTIVDVGEGTGGVTEPYKDRFMVYNDGSRKWLREVIEHEFTHLLHFHVLNAGFWKSGRILRSILFPLWMMEGWAADSSRDVEETWEELVIRDAATSKGLLPLTRLEHFGHLKPHQTVLAYKQGAAAMEFIASQYGERKIANLLASLEHHFESGVVLAANLGLDAADFDRKYREYLEDKYRRLAAAERLVEPKAYGRALTSVRGALPEHNAAPVFSPDGRRAYFLSTRGGFPPELEELDLSSGRRRRLPGIPRTAVEDVSMGHFTNLSRSLAISGDGSRLAFAGTRLHRDAIYLYGLADPRGRPAGYRRGLEKISLPGFAMVAQPAFSPDGRSIAFSGMKDCRTDIYLLDLGSRRVRQLTRDDRDDQMPAFSPSGGWLAYSSEAPDPRHPSGWRRRLFKVSLAEFAPGAPAPLPEPLESLEASARDPVFSPDGGRILFVLEEAGFSEVAELDLASGRAARLTRSLGGAFTPVYAPDGEIAFAALRRGSVHLHKGPRSLFLDETVAGPLSAAARRLPGLAAASARSSPAGAAPAGTVPLGSAPGASSPVPSPPPAAPAEAALSPERPYSFQAGTDLFLPAFIYSSEGGLFWTSYWQGSDLLGRHQAGVILGYGSHDSYFDYTGSYAYRRRRIQPYFAAVGRGQRNLYDPDKGLDYNGALHVQYTGFQYPLDRFHRLECGVASATERVVFHGWAPSEDRQTRAATAAFVRDTSRGRYLVVTGGNRLRLGYTRAGHVLGGNQGYDIASAEAHQFVPTGGQSALAGRLAFLRSAGPDRQAFVLGGVGGVRGYARGASGDLSSQVLVGNLEWRFPLVQDLNWYMWFFVPDFYFKAIFGTIFTDAGTIWRPGSSAGRTRWRDVRHSVGLGLRIHTFVMQEFPFVVALDYARQTTRDKGIFYVYLGQSF